MFRILLDGSHELSIDKLKEATGELFSQRNQDLKVLQKLNKLTLHLYIWILRTAKYAKELHTKLCIEEEMSMGYFREADTLKEAMSKIIKMNPGSPEAEICRIAKKKAFRQHIRACNAAEKIKKSGEQMK